MNVTRLLRLALPLLPIAALYSCHTEEPDIPVPVEEFSNSEILAMVRTDVPNTAFYKDIFLDGGCELNPGIKENGLVINGRLPYAMEKAGITNAEYFLSTIDDVGDGWIQSDHDIQTKLITGNPDDKNGVLLYPDGEPRFRMIFVFGGHSNPHGQTLGYQGRLNVKTFYENGGCYVGSCAGAFFSSRGVIDNDYTSTSGNLTIHCTQKGADWLSKTNLRWIYSGYNISTPVNVKFVDYKTSAELTTTWAAN